MNREFQGSATFNNEESMVKHHNGICIIQIDSSVFERRRNGGGDIKAKKIKVNKLSGKKASHSLAATQTMATFILLQAMLLIMGSCQIAVVRGKVNPRNSWCNSLSQMSHR